MTRERLADAYEEQAALFARLADATAQIAHELRGIDSPAHVGVPAAQAPVEVPAGVDPPASVGPSFDELPPEGFHSGTANAELFNREMARKEPEPALNPQVEAGLGKCPVHGKPWTVKAAGTNAAGKSYDAFFRCAEKDGDTWCKQKPQKIWRDLHPIPNGVAA